MADERAERDKTVRAKGKARTPEQQKVYDETQERNRRIQEAAIKPPASGIFGARPKGSK
jgi:hypothetical protein